MQKNDSAHITDVLGEKRLKILLIFKEMTSF